MPATRSPKQRKISSSFQTVKNTRTASGKKGGKAPTTASKKNLSSVVQWVYSHLLSLLYLCTQHSWCSDIPDDTSSLEEDVGLVPLAPSAKLDIKRYHKYFQSLKPRFGNVPLSTSPQLTPSLPLICWSENCCAHYNHLYVVHAEGQNEVHQILRMFDLSYEYGPCVGVTRSERWERAQALGLNPPPEVKFHFPVLTVVPFAETSSPI